MAKYRSARRPDGEYSYRRTLSFDRIREHLQATVERVRAGEPPSPDRIWEGKRVNGGKQ